MSLAKEFYVLNLQFDKNFEMDVTLKRLLSPLTCEALVSSLPITGRGWTARQGSGYYMIQLGIKRGTEKPTKVVEQGDVVYSAREDALILVFDEKSIPPSPVNKLGSINTNIDKLKDLARGINVKITLKEVL
jgi:hypothetical protein